jgi:hypothetical protein
MQRDSDVIVKRSSGVSVVSTVIVAIVVAAGLVMLVYRHPWPMPDTTGTTAVSEPASDSVNGATSGSGSQQSGGRTTTNTHPH